MRRVKISVREFGDHDGSSPRTSTVGARALGGHDANVELARLRRERNPFAVGRPVGFGRVGRAGSRDALDCAAVRRHFGQHAAFVDFVAKQIHCPSGDQQGDDSSSGVAVNCFKFEPSALQTHTSGLPLLLKIIATFEPSGETAALVFKPE